MFAENKEKKSTSSIKNESLVEHHQHNGNVKNITLYADTNEKKNVIDTELQIDKTKIEETNEEEHRISNMEIATPEDGNRENIEQGNKESIDEYEHSLWKWPSGRSNLTKVKKYRKNVIHLRIILEKLTYL